MIKKQREIIEKNMDLDFDLELDQSRETLLGNDSVNKG